MFSGDLGYMQKSIYTWFQFNECTEVCHTCDCSFYYVSYSIFFIRIQPRVLIFELQAQCDLVSVDIFDQNFDRLADFEDLLRVSTLPQDISEICSRLICSAQIDECTEICNVLNNTVYNIANCDLLKQSFLLFSFCCQ